MKINQATVKKNEKIIFKKKLLNKKNFGKKKPNPFEKTKKNH